MVVGYILAYAAGWLFAVSDVLVRGASKGLSPRDNLLLSLVYGTPLLAALSLAFGEGAISLEGLAVYSAIGALHFYLGRLLFYTAVANLGSASAAIIVSPSPIIASILAVALLGEPLTLWQVLGLTLVAVGVYIAAAEPTGKPLTAGGSKAAGALAGVGSTLIFSFTMVAVRWASGEYGSPLLGATASYTAALAIVSLTHRLNPGREAWGKVRYAALAGVAVALAQASRYTALSLIPVAEAAALISLFPVNTVIAASLAPWTEEKIRGRHIIAAGLAVVGVVATILGRS
ncbi:MAG: DMT family transporter [Desulfurococcales archaeon]|nr:DMT family transporter [Desulfurococcales archaeon]